MVTSRVLQTTLSTPIESETASASRHLGSQFKSFSAHPKHINAPALSHESVALMSSASIMLARACHISLNTIAKDVL